jgi:hypothetical protein
MRRRDVGSILLAIGVLCGIIYTLINLTGNTAGLTSTILMYTSVFALVAGLVFLGVSRVRR